MSSLAMPSSSVAGFRSSSFSPSPSRKKLPATLAPLTGGIGGGYAPSSPRLQPVGVGKGPSSSPTLVASSSSPTFGGTASSSPHRTKSSTKTGTSPHGPKGSNRPAGLSPSKIESGRRSGRSEAESATEISARSGGGGDKAGAQQHVDPAIGTQSIAGLRAQLRELTALLDLHTTDPTVAVDIWRTESQRDPYLRQRCALVDSGRTSLPDTVYDDARIAAENEEKKEVDEQKNIEVEVPLLTPTAAAKVAGSGGSDSGTVLLARQTSSGNASTTEGISGQASPTAAGGPKRGSLFGGSLTVPGAGNGGSQTIGHSGRQSPSPTPSDGAQSKRSSVASFNGEASATSRDRGAKRVAAKAKPRSSVRTASPGPKLQRDSASSKTPSETGKRTAPTSEALPAKAGDASTQEAGSAGPEAVVEGVSPLASDSPPDAGASQVQEHSLMSLSSGAPVDPQAGSGRSLANDSPQSATETLEKQLRLGRGLSLKVPSGERAAIAAPEPDVTVDGNNGERRKDRRDSEVSHGASLHSGSPLVAPPPGARKLSSTAGASMTGGDHGGGLGSSVGSGRAMSHTSVKPSSGAVASLLQPTTAGMNSHGQRSASPLESLRLIEEAKGGLSPRAKAVVQLMQSRNVDQSGSPNPLSMLSGGLNSSESSATHQEGFAIPAPRTVGGGSKGSSQGKGLAPLPIKKDTPVVPLSLQQQQSIATGGSGPGSALLNSQFSASQFGPQLATMGTFTGTGSPQLAPLQGGGTIPLPPDAQELTDLEIELFELRGSVKQKKLECRKWRATMDRDKTDGTHPQAKYAEPIEDMQRKCILEQNALDAQLAALRAELREASEAVETQSAKIAMMSSHVERSGGDLDAALSTGGVATERDLKPLIAQAEAAVAQATDTLEQQRQYQKRYFDRTAATMDAMEDRLQSQRENALRADLIRRGLDPDEIMSKLQFFAPPKDLKDRDQQDGTGTQGAAVQDLSKGPSPVPQSLSLSHGHSPQGQSPQTQSPQARSPGGQMGKKTSSTPGPTPKHGKTSHVLSVSPTPKRGDPLQLSMERRSSLSTDGPPEEPDAEGFMAHDPHGEWMYQLERLQKEHDARVARKKRREEEKKRREEERQAEREKKLHHHPAAAHPASHPPVANTPHHHRDSGLPVSSSFHHLHSSVVLTPKNGKSPPPPAPIEEPKVPVVPTSQPILLESPSGKEMLHDIIADDIVATLHTEGKEREAIAEMYGQSLRILARKEVAANLKVQADEARRIAASKDPGMSFTGIGRTVAERHREHGTEFQFTKLGRRIDVDATEVTDEKGTLSKSMSFTTPAAQAAALAKHGGSVRKPPQQQQGGKVSQAQAGAQSSTTSIKQAGASGRQPLPARAGGASPTKLIQSEPGSFIQSSSGSPTKQKAGQQGFQQQGLQQGKAGQQGQGQGPMSPALSAQRRGSGVSTMSMSQAMSQASARSRGRGSNGSGVQGRGRGK